MQSDPCWAPVLSSPPEHLFPMEAKAAVPTPPPAGELTESPRQRDIRESVEGLLESSSGKRVELDRRQLLRLPYRKPITVLPIDDDSGEPNPTRRFAAFGTDISRAGIGFLSRELVPTRQALLVCAGTDEAEVLFVLEPTWVKFSQGGWYQTGGRFVRTVNTIRDLV